MGLGQSKQHRWTRDPRYPIDFQQHQHPPQPFIPGYTMPVGYPQPTMYPQQGFIPPVYGQGAALPPSQLHYFPEGRPRRHKTRRSAREDLFVGGFVQDQPSPPGICSEIIKSGPCINIVCRGSTPSVSACISSTTRGGSRTCCSFSG